MAFLCTIFPMINGRETFQKSEKLCSRKIITGLFDTGNTLYTPLFKVIWAKYPLKNSVPAQIAFSVAKRSFRHAVTRNLLKRRMREAYRKNKNLLYNFLSSEKIQVAIVVIYRANDICVYSEIAYSINEMLEKLIVKIREKAD
jgi:ribonuclease P protein component